MTEQLPLFPQFVTKFPSTRYQGSKAKLVNWIWDHISEIPFDTCLDGFGGTGAVSYRLKQENKQVTYNDNLRFNAWIGTALIENSKIQITDDDINQILDHRDIEYPTFIADTFADIYFTDEENQWLDRIISNIHHLDDSYKKTLAFFAVAQSCIIKRPYNLFHRKNLYIRTADVERTFGNKASWDRAFEDWFRHFVDEANNAVFDNGQANCATHHDIFDVEGNLDLVYLDPPYISNKGVGVDYRDFYHFLEGLTDYPKWKHHIDLKSKHRRLIRQHNVWSDKSKIYHAFEQVFERFSDSIIVVSYRSDGIPTELDLVNLLKRYKKNIRIERYQNYQYALSKNKKSSEILLIGQ